MDTIRHTLGPKAALLVTLLKGGAMPLATAAHQAGISLVALPDISDALASDGLVRLFRPLPANGQGLELAPLHVEACIRPQTMAVAS